MRPRTTIGTLIMLESRILRHTSACSGVGAVAAISSPVISGAKDGSPVRITAPIPAGSSSRGAAESWTSQAQARRSGSPCMTATRSMVASAARRSTAHQSAKAGTARRATVASVSW
jgi:hypothetical protein